jgi:hypothetical protein
MADPNPTLLAYPEFPEPLTAAVLNHLQYASRVADTGRVLAVHMLPKKCTFDDALPQICRARNAFYFNGL